MLKKCKYNEVVFGIQNALNIKEVTICGANIKPYKTKEIIKPMIPDKLITSWGIFIHLKLDNGDQYDAVWKLDNTLTSEYNDVPCLAPKKKKTKKENKNKIPESPVATVLRAAGVKEWVDLIGTKVRIKPIPSMSNSYNGFCISPINEEKGRWFYPDYFELHVGRVGIDNTNDFGGNDIDE